MTMHATATKLDNYRTLVLNQGYEPIDDIAWSDGIKKILKEKASVVVAYDDVKVHTDKVTFEVPAVIWLHRNVMWLGRKGRRPPPAVKFNRKNVLARDACTCQYCGVRFTPTQLTFDHVTPRSRGGKTNWTNIVMACKACNGRKGDRTPKEAGMPLLKRPRKPLWLPSIMAKRLSTGSVPVQWNEFLNWI